MTPLPSPSLSLSWMTVHSSLLALGEVTLCITITMDRSFPFVPSLCPRHIPREEGRKERKSILFSTCLNHTFHVRKGETRKLSQREYQAREHFHISENSWEHTKSVSIKSASKNVKKHGPLEIEISPCLPIFCLPFPSVHSSSLVGLFSYTD